jgi:hypothetical protein
MKTIIAFLLCLSILVAPVQAQTNDPPKPGGAVVCFVVFSACVGLAIFWYVKGCLPSQSGPVRFELLKTHNMADWQVVCSKIVTLNGTNSIELFKVEIQKDKDDLAFYKTRWDKDWHP